MDLCEYKNKDGQRHPWEIARVNAIVDIIKLSNLSLGGEMKVLDVGCGDGFIIQEVLKGFGVKQIDAFDPNLSNDQITSFSAMHENINFNNSLSALKKENYDLITLFDVIEHTEDDNDFLKSILSYASLGAIVLLTAPAFNQLFSNHDAFLSHYRRYSLKELTAIVRSEKLKIVNSGYLFFSLLLVRFFGVVFEKIKGNSGSPNKGVSNWQYGHLLTKCITSVLSCENKLLILLGSKSLIVPGLSVWVVCKKPQ